jgi:hypothetical protein
MTRSGIGPNRPCDSAAIPKRGYTRVWKVCFRRTDLKGDPPISGVAVMLQGRVVLLALKVIGLKE